MTEPVTEPGLLTETPAVENQPAQITPWHGEDYAEVVEKKGWDSADAVLKSYTELEKGMGNKVKIPDGNSSQEEISAFYQKIGVPENAEGYEMNVPENIPRDENFENVMKSVAHESGIPKAGFEAMVKTYYDTIGAAMAQERETTQTALQGEWKTDYEANLEISRRACKELFGDETIQYLNNSGLGNNLLLTKGFFSLGKKMLSDTAIQGDAQPKADPEYKPQYQKSPEMYNNDTSEDGIKARLWHTQHGHVYG